MLVEEVMLKLSIGMDPGVLTIWKELGAKLASEGLLEERRFLTLVGEGPRELLGACFDDERGSNEDIIDLIGKLFEQVKEKVGWRKRVGTTGLHPQLDDVLTTLGRETKRGKFENGRGPNDGDRQGKTSLRVRPTWAAKRERTVKSLEEMDERNMEKWTARAIRVLENAETPSWVQAQTSGNPPLVLRGLLGRARASTIRLRVRSWETYSRWLWWRRGLAWPSGPLDFIEYASEAMGDTPVASFPRSFGASLAWFEARAGIPPEEKLSTKDMVRRFLEKAALDAMGGGAPVLKAPRLPLAALLSLELAVSDIEWPAGLRVIAWTRLLKNVRCFTGRRPTATETKRGDIGRVRVDRETDQDQDVRGGESDKRVKALRPENGIPCK